MAGDRNAGKSGAKGVRVIDEPGTDLKDLKARGLSREILIAIYRNKKTPLVDEYDAMSQ